MVCSILKLEVLYQELVLLINMASILFLGYSNLLRKRIMPVLNKLGIASVSIAKFQNQFWDDGYKMCNLPITLFDSYEEGLSKFNGDLVYISTVNSTHFIYAKQCLIQGFHTIIDKPATLCFEEAKELLSLARSKQLLLSEATVYLYHPQLLQIDSIFHNYGDEPKLLTVHFSMPPFLEDNFRYHRELGGGAIHDTVPYAVSLGRYFFRTQPLSAVTLINETLSDGLDIEYSLLMKYPGGKSLIGHFGFNTEYVNQVVLMGTRTRIELNRIFTIPADMRNTLSVVHENVTTQEIAESANSFELYFENILSRLEKCDFENLYASLINDARARDMITNNII